MKVKVCLIQDSPVFFDIEKTIDKIESLVKTYAKQGCELIVFPESFIPGYPRGFSFGAVVGSRTDKGRKLYADYHKNSLDLEGKELHRLVKLAKTEKVYLIIGNTEKQSNSGSLYCSMLYISPTDGFLGVHRKIKPTGSERIIWNEDDGSSLVSFDTKIGKLGGLICWENYMPLARMAMYQKGVEIYIAPTADSREEWTSTMKHIALEGRCFVLGCNQYYTKSMYPEKYQHLLENEPENLCRGGSVIVSPLGKVIAGPLFNEAGALVAEIDLNEIVHAKLDFDVNGHYSRNDIFDFKVNNQPDIKVENKTS
ncbi:carbon-nitrogen hydrolase family protein [Maribacter sp. 1_MG-2023]|uniref:carbon-nitrogen hydrolase family protein n=1 Tax=Maribacter sp. 1_MG-2023 TaxID=3062677 RepID=UPI0026E26DF4|nr:carbon-nitrogen hydrolase family protein [Maribacter sp. 1_MG-2023]MDO6473294.1 carbon-nitrogen hydrolase family protein [Maribacter sp. 1_MG-2023]